jgi:hypothetical protein
MISITFDHSLLVFKIDLASLSLLLYAFDELRRQRQDFTYRLPFVASDLFLIGILNPLSTMTRQLHSFLCLFFVALLTTSSVAQKTLTPTTLPSSAPSEFPTGAPSAPTERPSGAPSSMPSALPTGSPVAFVGQTYTGGAGDQNFTWYLPFDPQTYSAYSTHWITSHESWLYDQYDPTCLTQNTLPVCVAGKLLEDPGTTCPSSQCMGISYADDPCQSTPLDTIDYIPPPITAAGVSAANQCLPTTDQSYLLPPYYGLDSGLPPLYTPLKAINLKITGHVFGRTGALCSSIGEVKIDYWHVKTDLLTPAYDQFYNKPEEVSHSAPITRLLLTVYLLLTTVAQSLCLFFSLLVPNEITQLTN